MNNFLFMNNLGFCLENIHYTKELENRLLLYSFWIDNFYPDRKNMKVNENWRKNLEYIISDKLDDDCIYSLRVYGLNLNIDGSVTSICRFNEEVIISKEIDIQLLFRFIEFKFLVDNLFYKLENK